MSKKQKRSVSGISSEEIKSVAAPVAPAARRFSAVSTEFNPDYTHVIAGLKRIGVLAGSAVVIMIILTFIIK
jgi:hypothetical protein